MAISCASALARVSHHDQQPVDDEEQGRCDDGFFAWVLGAKSLFSRVPGPCQAMGVGLAPGP